MGPVVEIRPSVNIDVQVLSMHEKVNDIKSGEALANVMHWVMTSKQNVTDASLKKTIPAAKTFLFDKIEFYWNTKPIRIPKISIKGNFDDFVTMGSSGTKSTVDVSQLLGNVEIVLTAISFTTY